MAVCEGCGEPIFWRTNDKTGKVAPVDELPVPNGNVTLVGADQYHVLLKAERHALVEPGFFDDEPPPRYMLHFVTCKHPEVFRKRDQKAHRAGPKAKK